MTPRFCTLTRELCDKSKFQAGINKNICTITGKPIVEMNGCPLLHKEVKNK